MKQKNKRIPRNKINFINSNKVESNVGNDGKKGSNTKSSCDFKKLLCIGRRLKKKFMERKNMYEEKKEEKDFMHKVLKNLLDFHPLILSGISLISMICYFVYFGLFIGYFPVLSGSEIFYVGVLLFFVVGIFTSFVILPMIFYPIHIKSSLKYKTYGKYLSLLLLVLSFPIALLIAFIVNKLFYIDKEEILFVFLVALAFSYVLSCIAMWIKEKIKKLIVGLIAVVFIISIFLYSPQITTISIFLLFVLHIFYLP